MVAVHSINGKIITDHVGVCELGTLSSCITLTTVSLEVSGIMIPVPDPPIGEEPHTLKYVREVKSRTKSGKAAGIYSILLNS